MDSTGGTPAIADATAADEVRAKVAARMAMAREARRLAEDVRPRWAAIVAGMYVAVALGAVAVGLTRDRDFGGSTSVAIAVYATALAAGAWRLRVGRDRDPRAFPPLSGAFAHALIGLWGVEAILLLPLDGCHGWATVFVLLSFAAMLFGTVPLLFTAMCTRRGGLLLAASLLGPLLLQITSR
ncbi:MAG: hypothetical protein JNM10_08615 [Planctomycetia bacterium]|nr:hypothetical protein [Planctomycetia bacterium]